MLQKVKSLLCKSLQINKKKTITIINEQYKKSNWRNKKFECLIFIHLLFNKQIFIEYQVYACHYTRHQVYGDEQKIALLSKSSEYNIKPDS